MESNDAEYEGPDTPVVYFLELPLGDVLKVGTTTVRRLFNRIDTPQAYFAEDVTFLGITYCSSKKQASSIQNYIKNNFGTSRSHRNDLIPDTCQIRKFIQDYFIDAEFDLEISRELERERIKESRQ